MTFTLGFRDLEIKYYKNTYTYIIKMKSKDLIDGLLNLIISNK